MDLQVSRQPIKTLFLARALFWPPNILYYYAARKQDAWRREHIFSPAPAN
jgi:hypothetical protein